jgi:hypothetical protein
MAHEGLDRMKAALLPDRGVVKITGDGARNFLQGLVTADMLDLTPGTARFAALLTPQGKIIADFIVVEAADGGGFFLDIPRTLGASLVEKFNLYRSIQRPWRAGGMGRRRYNVTAWFVLPGSTVAGTRLARDHAAAICRGGGCRSRRGAGR